MYPSAEIAAVDRYDRANTYDPLTQGTGENARVSQTTLQNLEVLDVLYELFVDDHSHGCYGNWPQSGTQWVQLEWSQPISTKQVEVYWWDDGRGVRLPTACRLLYWDGQAFVPVREAVGLGVAGGKYNTTTFAEVTNGMMRSNSGFC